MKSRHNTRQNQPIVNAADDTSDAIRSSTRACGVSVHRAANNPTANSGSTINASRNTRVRWCSMAILASFTAGYGTVAAGGFKNLEIRD